MKFYQSSCLSFIVCFSFCFTKLSAQTSFVDSFLHDGLYRSYRVYIPAINDGTKEVPLVLNMHGLGSNAMEQEAYADFRPIADTANFIVVQPEGANLVFSYKGWNTFGSIGTGTDDLGFISQLMDTLKHRFQIDSNRIYATGFSNGGFMSYELACFLNNQIAAIASVSGSMTEERRVSCNALRPTPVLQIHGTNDPTVGYDGTNYLSGAPAFTDIDSLMQYWSKLNTCSATASATALPNTSTSDGCTAVHYVWSGGQDGSSVELYKVIGGEHTWPGSSFSTGVTNQDFNASVEIWRFFNQYRLDQFSLGIEQMDVNHGKISIYPNPVLDQLNINVEGLAQNAMSELSLTDMMGKQIWSQSIQGASQFIIARNNIPAGIYYLSMRNETSSFVQKVIFK